MQSAKSNALEARKLGLVDSGPKAGGMRWLSDQQYYRTLSIHDILWRYVIKRFPNEAECPVVVLGYGSLPIAIELSQWTYPVTYIAYSEAEKKQVLIDAAAQAGTFKNLIVHDWYKDVPQARVLLFTGLLSGLTEKQLYDWLDMILSRVFFVVCAEHSRDRNWKRVLQKRYHVSGILYNHKEYTFLEIRRR